MWVLVGFNGGHNDVTFKARPLCNLMRCTALWKCDITDRSKAVFLMWSLLVFWCQSFDDVSLYVCSLYF